MTNLTHMGLKILHLGSAIETITKAIPTRIKFTVSIILVVWVKGGSKASILYSCSQLLIKSFYFSRVSPKKLYFDRLCILKSIE